MSLKTAEIHHKIVVVVVILFPTEYKQWRTEQLSNITTTINIDDPVGGHQRSQRLIGLATNTNSTLPVAFSGSVSNLCGT